MLTDRGSGVVGIVLAGYRYRTQTRHLFLGRASSEAQKRKGLFVSGCRAVALKTCLSYEESGDSFFCFSTLLCIMIMCNVTTFDPPFLSY